MTLYTLAESNMRKTWLYLGLFLAMIVLLGWFLSYYFESAEIFWLAFFISILMSVGSFWYSDKVVLAMSGAKLIEKKDNPELYRLVENLCITAGLPLPRIYIINDASPNAFAIGKDPAHSVVAVTIGLLEKLERVELEGVIAHELAHIGNRDTFLATIVVILVGLVIKLTDIFFRMGFRRDEGGRSKSSAVIMVFGLALLILAPFLAQLIRFAISRKREFLADATGALLTRYPEGLASALEKISQDPKILRGASNATAHLYIVNPFKGQKATSFLVKLFSTHPSIEERIKALKGMEI